MHALCRLQADGAACSEQVQKSEKNVMHHLYFFSCSMFSAVAFADYLLSVHESTSNVHVLCSE
jgi:hypothetical protein